MKRLAIALMTLIILTNMPPLIAAGEKAGAACAKLNGMATINGKKFVCAVPATQWKTSTKSIWIELDKYSKDMDKLTATFDEKTMYQHCLVVNGGPLPGKSGKVPDAALNLCQGLPGAPKKEGSANNQSNDPSQGFPPGLGISQNYLDCLSNNGFTAKNLNELLANVRTSKYEAAYKTCNSLAPALIASQIK